MAPVASVILMIVIVTPIAWLASEFGKYRTLRILLGITAIASAMGVAYLVGHFSRFNYNAWYGGASKDLIETAILEIEDGNMDRVMSVLRRLNLDYQPTYENRAHYDELVRDAVEEMKSSQDLKNKKVETSPFTQKTWLGHWEDDSGFWLAINQLQDLGIVRSGDNMPKMTQVSLSDDSKTLTFTEGDQWKHELTLKNKYEATHVWRELPSKVIFKTDTLHRLTRATPAQREFTQQVE